MYIRSHILLTTIREEVFSGITFHGLIFWVFRGNKFSRLLSGSFFFLFRTYKQVGYFWFNCIWATKMIDHGNLNWVALTSCFSENHHLWLLDLEKIAGNWFTLFDLFWCEKGLGNLQNFLPTKTSLLLGKIFKLQ